MPRFIFLRSSVEKQKNAIIKLIFEREGKQMVERESPPNTVFLSGLFLSNGEGGMATDKEKQKQTRLNF